MKQFSALAVSLLLVVALALSVSLVSCSPSPEGGSGGDGAVGELTVLEIIVKVLPDATNLVYTVGNNTYTNDIYIVGALSNFHVNSLSGPQLGFWEVSDTNAKMTLLSNDTDGLPLYYIKLVSDSITSGTTIEFKFVNGTPGFGGDWALVEKSADGGEISVNRKATVTPNTVNVSYFTNTNRVVGDNVDIGKNGIQKWNSVGPSYPVNNVTVVIMMSNVTTSTNGPWYTDEQAGYTNVPGFAFVGSAKALSRSGTRDWGGITDNKDFRVVQIIETNGTNISQPNGLYTNYLVTLKLEFTYSGKGSFAYKLQAYNNGSWSWESGADHTVLIPLNATSVTSIVGANSSFFTYSETIAVYKLLIDLNALNSDSSWTWEAQNSANFTRDLTNDNIFLIGEFDSGIDYWSAKIINPTKSGTTVEYVFDSTNIVHHWGDSAKFSFKIFDVGSVGYNSFDPNTVPFYSGPSGFGSIGITIPTTVNTTNEDYNGAIKLIYLSNR